VNQQETDEKLNVLQEVVDRLKIIETDVGKLKSQNQNQNSNFRRGYTYRRPYRGGFRSQWSGRRHTTRDGQQESTQRKETDKEEEKSNLNVKRLSSEGSMGAQK
jgi:conjugal transfer/entry exclusion protein